MLRKCIATVALSGNLADKLEAAARAGFDGVEVMEADLLAYDGSPADIRRIAGELGIAIYLYQPFRDFEAMAEPLRVRNLDRAERKFDITQALGADLVLVCSNTQAAAIDDDRRAAADLRAMAERAAIRGLRVGFEALSWGTNIRCWRHAWRIVQQADHPALGLIVDSFHTLALRDDPAGLADVPGERIFFVQLADAPFRDMDVLSWSRHYRNFPGQGDLPIGGFVRAVREYDERGSTVPELLGPVLLVPLKARRDAGAVDPERVEDDAGLRAIERHAEHAHVAVACGADLELVRVGLADVEGAKRAGRALAARRDADDANSVDEDVERAPVRLLEVGDLGACGARGDVRPRARALLACLDADACEAVEAVACELPLRELAALRRPLGRHPATDSLLEVALPRLADRDEAATPVAEATLERAANHGGLDVRGGVRVAELNDAHVLLRLAGLELCDGLEEPPERGRTLEGSHDRRARRCGDGHRGLGDPCLRLRRPRRAGGARRYRLGLRDCVTAPRRADGAPCDHRARHERRQQCREGRPVHAYQILARRAYRRKFV